MPEKKDTKKAIVRSLIVVVSFVLFVLALKFIHDKF